MQISRHTIASADELSAPRELSFLHPDMVLPKATDLLIPRSTRPGCRVAARFTLAARMTTGLSKRSFAARAGICESQVQNIEQCRFAPTATTMTKIARAAGFELALAFIDLDGNLTACANAAQFVPAVRLATGLTRAELARRAGLNKAVLHASEVGRHAPTASTLSAIAAAANRKLELGFWVPR